ncbi:unnamed protein product [Trifolium pratense]|uniref:Uncharacterized protein n=1 Tax=Trifolium pratense TaxID=57577 RepID=A0ACB0KCZ8_TRIPR|nr:unnamed protein product [Trifolium pratense]
MLPDFAYYIYPIITRSTLTPVASGGLSKELTHDSTWRNTLTECMNMIPIGADDRVLFLKKLNESSWDSFLVIVQVNKTKHFAL